MFVKVKTGYRKKGKPGKRQQSQKRQDWESQTNMCAVSVCAYCVMEAKTRHQRARLRGLHLNKEPPIGKPDQIRNREWTKKTRRKTPSFSSLARHFRLVHSSVVAWRIWTWSLRTYVSFVDVRLIDKSAGMSVCHSVSLFFFFFFPLNYCYYYHHDICGIYIISFFLFRTSIPNHRKSALYLMWIGDYVRTYLS